MKAKAGFSDQGTSESEEGCLAKAFDACCADVCPEGEQTLDVEALYSLLGSLGFSGRTSAEREIIDLTVIDTCGTSVTFAVLQDLCQLICERLSTEEVQEQYANADALGLSKDRLHKLQAAFDHVRTKDHPVINVLDLPKVFAKVLATPPRQPEVVELLEMFCPKRKEMTFLQFLQAMCWLFSRQVSLTQEQAFTLQSVSEKKLREILRLFPFSPEAVEDLSAHELPELVAHYLGVRGTTDLRELQHPVNNVRQLLALARKRSLARADTKQPQLLVQQIETAVRSGNLRYDSEVSSS
jgi:Ca2+-binding EF-hand superfamily protein